jgi:hypothetical protein
MSDAHSRLNAGSAAGLAAAEDHLDALTRAYARALRAAGSRAAARFGQTRTITAATAPDWIPPPPGSLIDTAELAADTERKTASVHKAILTAAATESFAPFDLSFDIHAPASQALLDRFAARIQATIQTAMAEQVTEAVQQGYAEGASVRTVADAIQAATSEISRARAEMLARSDLNGIANGASVLAAQASGAAVTKVWKTAEDDLVRPDHADADGQEVGIAETFDVGGEDLAYPGDPNGSWEQVANCRCTVLYSTGAEITASAAPNGHAQAGLAMLPPMRLQLPRQQRPVAHVKVAAPDVQIHNRIDVAAPDTEAIARALADLGPLLAAGVSDPLLAELARVLETLAAVAGRDLPAPSVMVAAASPAEAPDLSGIGPAVVAGLAPYLEAILALGNEILAALNSPRQKQVKVNRSRGGEITNLTIEEG